MASIAVSAGGSSPLLNIKVSDLGRAGNALAAVRIDARFSTTVKSSTGVRMGLSHLLALDSSTRDIYAAQRDSSGLWSEWGFFGTQSFTNYTPGSVEGGILSGLNSDELLTPSIAFPDLSMGSGRMLVHRTIISKGPDYRSESRRTMYGKSKSVFHCQFQDLDRDQVRCIHTFFRVLGGPAKPFWFDWNDPLNGMQATASSTRYAVRFRDPKLASSLFDVDRSEIQSFYLIESGGTSDDVG